MIHRASAFACTFFAELEVSAPIQFRQTQVAEAHFEKEEARRFGATDTFADFLEILAMELHEIAEGLETGDP